MILSEAVLVLLPNRYLAVGQIVTSLSISAASFFFEKILFLKTEKFFQQANGEMGKLPC